MRSEEYSSQASSAGSPRGQVAGRGGCDTVCVLLAAPLFESPAGHTADASLTLPHTCRSSSPAQGVIDLPLAWHSLSGLQIGWSLQHRCIHMPALDTAACPSPEWT